MFRFLHPTAAGVPRIVGPACGKYIGPPGPNYNVMQSIVPPVTLPSDKDPKYSKEIHPYIRRLNYGKIKARRAKPITPRGGFSMKKPLRIAVRVGQHENNRAIERTSPFDALGYSPRYLLQNGSGKAPKRLHAAQSRAPRVAAANEAIVGLEPASMADSKQLAQSVISM